MLGQQAVSILWNIFGSHSNSRSLVTIRRTSRLPVGSVPFVCVHSVGPLSLALDFLSVCRWFPRAHSQSETGFLSVDSAQRFADKQFTKQVIWVIWYVITSISILRAFNGNLTYLAVLTRLRSAFSALKVSNSSSCWPCCWILTLYHKHSYNKSNRGWTSYYLTVYSNWAFSNFLSLKINIK